MKLKVLMLLTALMIGFTGVRAQINVSGTVVAADNGEPLMGAAVRVIGTDKGVATDLDGNFKLNVSKNAVLSISFMGMRTKEVKATATPMRIELETDAAMVDEVVVMAFGTAKKSAFTGSAAVVKAEDINKVQVSNPLDALTGKAAGVQINNFSNQPGESQPSIMVRGISSINAGISPLIVVDGAPFAGDLNTISNQDIESITVLKDAASAALYGARGANGVVLITTKSATRGAKDGGITLDAKWGVNSRALPDYNTINSPAKYYEMWYAGLSRYAQNQLGYSANEAAMFANQNLTANNGYGLGYNLYTVPEGEYMIGANGRLNPNATLGNTYLYNGNEYTLLPDNWTKEIYGTGLRQEYTLSGHGSTERSTLLASVNYTSINGITINSNSKRLTGRIKADHQLKKWLKIGANVTYAHYSGNFVPSNGSIGDSGNLFSFTQMAPIYPVYIRDGKGNIIFDPKSGINSYDYGDGSINGMQRPVMTNANPLSSNRLETNYKQGNAFSATAFAEVRFLNDFKFTTTNTVNNDEARFNSTTNPFFGQYASLNGYVSVSHVRTFDYNIQQLLNWSHDYGQHSIDAMLGHEYYRAESYNLSGARQNMFDLTNPELSGAITVSNASSGTVNYNVEGFFARAQYNYGMKYFGSLSFRSDGSSRFHKNHRWGNFWSVGGAWRLGQEKWLVENDWIDELKLKASIGQQGNDNIGNYLFTNQYTIGSNAGDIALIQTNIAKNENITWETGTNFNTGVEFSFWRGRLSGSFEYFYRKTADMLYAFPITPSLGQTLKYVNVGDMRNSGVEFELSGDIIRNNNLTWSAHANITAYGNKITKLPAERRTMTVDGVDGYSSGILFFGEGEAFGTFYLPKYAGVDKNTGESLFYKDVKDQYGKVIGQETTSNYTDATYHLCGGSLADAYGGFGTSLSWKGLSVSVDFSYQIGGKLYDYTYANQMTFGRGSAFHADLLKSWTEESTNTDVPRMQFNDPYTAASSDRFLTSASYLCLQNVNIGYQLPTKWIKHIGLQQVRVYASGDNLWMWSKRQGLDPRQSLGSSSAEYYAPMRTISGGITVSF